MERDLQVSTARGGEQGGWADHRHGQLLIHDKLHEHHHHAQRPELHVEECEPTGG